MPRPKRSEPPILAMLEKAFAKYRKKVKPRFPYDAQTDVIHLPHDIEVELRYLVLTGKGVEAVKRVTELTGAGLRVSKDYVDSLARQQ
jgi:ribosomal protein L7/L12